MSHTLFVTHSGKLIDYTNINPDLINLDDIAHHLCQENRYGGSFDIGIKLSVARHSINCYKVGKRMCFNNIILRMLLMHDASEYLLKDIPSGLKRVLPEYIKLEKKVTDIIFNKYGISQNEDYM